MSTLLSRVYPALRRQHISALTAYRTLSAMATNNVAPKWPISNDVPDLTGKVALVTGANSSGGMGFHTAYQMASKNAKVYIGARSASKAQSAIDEMRTGNPSIDKDQLVPFVADLSDVKAVRAAAQALVQSEDKLDILVHNAAIISMPLVLDSNGISVSFTTNHLSPFVLTNALLPLLESSAKITGDTRVVMVSATSYKLLPPGIRFDSVDSFNLEMEPTVVGGADFTRYSLSKLANILFSQQLQKNFNGSGIDAISLALHPGLIKTDGVINWLVPGGGTRTLEGRLTPEEGAITAIFAATSPKVLAEKETYKGAFLVPPGTIEELVGDAKDEKLAQELWTTSERAVSTIFQS
ncbi:short-chain dehydrogenase [Xylariales sp. PMI_506]|nr:short-chain dehydrogenase [Xylariales sp. PMI_506]